MKDKIKKYFSIAQVTAENAFEKARSIGLGKKLLFLIAGIIVVATVLGILIRVLSILFDTITVFVNEHFFGLAALATTGSWLIVRHNEKKREAEKLAAQKRAGLDNQRQRFVKGAYNRIGNFIFSKLASEPNFEALTSCTRPIRPEDMGNERIDAYCINGIMYLRYCLPKATTELLDTSMILSILQGMIDQKIRTGGLSPFIAAGRNDYLYVDKVDDMQTYVSVTMVLNFDENYILSKQYEEAMADIWEREQGNRTLKDSDYN